MSQVDSGLDPWNVTQNTKRHVLDSFHATGLLAQPQTRTIIAALRYRCKEPWLLSHRNSAKRFQLKLEHKHPSYSLQHEDLV
jgi:hypothetical protein